METLRQRVEAAFDKARASGQDQTYIGFDDLVGQDASLRAENVFEVSHHVSNCRRIEATKKLERLRCVAELQKLREQFDSDERLGCGALTEAITVLLNLT